ncbi:MAG: YCF48-related protein [Bacteroidota bacterium]
MKKIFCNLVFLIIVTTVLSHAQWNKMTFPTTENLWKVRFADANTGWVAGQQFIYRTTNGGTNWTPQDSTKGSVFAMEALDAQTLLYSGYTLGIRRTMNGGQTWTQVDTTKHFYDDMTFASANVGYVCGSAAPAYIAPIVRKTTNGGAAWFTVTPTLSKAKYELTGISFVTDSIGWTVSYDGFVFKTVNGGTDWIVQDSLGMNSYKDICFYNKNYGWIVGGLSGTQKMAYTTNGGTNWVKISQGGSSIWEIEIIDQSHAWYGGSNNSAPFIGRLDSIGGTWKEQTILAQNPSVTSIDMVNTTVGYAVGNLGGVYKTTNGGALTVFITDNHPYFYSLGQNYPNPFNPATSIDYEVGGAVNVRIDIYNLLGQFVGTVVNQGKGPGRYTATFNARSLSSGMYFYSMRAGNFVSVKRMVLLK